MIWISIALLIAAVMMLVLSLTPLFAWFVQGSRLNSTGVNASVVGTRYELLVTRTAERYNNTTDYPGVANAGGLKDRLAAVGYSFTHTSTENAPGLAFELVNEFRYDNLYNMMPGAYGTLTFYVKPLAGYENLQADLDLRIGGYHTVYHTAENETEVASLDPVESTTVLDMMKGHLLFFTGRTGATYEDYKYTGLIDDGVIHFSTAGRTPTQIGGETCYEVTLYWEWPETYYSIANNINAQNGNTEKYPYELRAYIDDHRDYFFASNANSSNPQELSNGYDDGDQSIGDNVKYIVVYVS